MATYDPLRDSRDTLMIAAIATLTDAGYTWNQKTTSFSEYLATALTGIGGSTVSNKTMSITQLLAGLINEIGAGPVSHLTSSFDQLLAILGSNTAGPTIQLSSSTIAEDASVGDLVGTLSVSGGTGTYSFTLTDDAGGLFALDGTDDTLLEVAAALSDGTESITVEADNGVDDPISRVFSITVTAVEVVVPAAPALTWNSLETDDEPDFLVDLPSGNVDPDEDAAAGDHLIIEYQLQAGGAWTEYLDYTLLSGDITDDTISVTGVGSVANGDYFFRGRLERGALVGTNSANASVTINVVTVPVNSVAPVISGNTQVTETLTTTDGTWSNTPTGYTYQWKRDGSNITSATANTYVLVELDAGADITCEVTASNGAGSGTPAASNTLGIDVYLVYLGHTEDPNDNSTYSANTFGSGGWQSAPLGVAAANRKIILAFASRNSGGTGGVISAASVAGQSAMPAQVTANSDGVNNKAVILVADVPTGTTGNISVTLTASQSRAGAGLWAMYGAGSSTASDTDTTVSAADGNVTLTVPAKGVAIGVSYHQSAGTATWTGLTGRYDAVLEATIEHAGADLNSNAGGNINMISDWSAADTNGAHAFASWGP